MQYANTKKYYSAFKKINPVLILNEISQLQKDEYCTIPLTWDTKVVKFKKSERMVIAQGLREGDWELFNGKSFSHAI